MTSSTREPEYRFDLSGGVLCLDFANTVSHRFNPERLAEHVNAFPDLISFAEQSKVLSSQAARAQRTRARTHVADAHRAYSKAITLRESFYRAFSAAVAGVPVASQDLQLIDEFVREALTHRKLIKSGKGYQWQWEANGSKVLDRILWPIAQSAAELLTSDQLGSVRLCDAPDCDWLFLDNSRNRSRRWCDMKSCGNRQKARRHYSRSHK